VEKWVLASRAFHMLLRQGEDGAANKKQRPHRRRAPMRTSVSVEDAAHATWAKDDETPKYPSLAMDKCRRIAGS